MEHSGRVVVVTGGSRGIGRAVALRFSSENARVVIVHYDPEEEAANETLAMLEGKGVRAESCKLDVADHGKAKAAFDGFLEKFKRVDVLVNNAGITRDALLMRMTEGAWDAVMNVNLKGVFNCTHAVVRAMARQRSGNIVSISSVAGQIGNVGQANYSASKAGIMGFTKTLAREVASRGVRVNAVAPGFINTEMTQAVPEKSKAAFLQQIPMGTLGEPEDVAEAVYWLCSDAARYVTGQIIHVNGGLFM